jgi:HlyD family secretion protein
MNRAGFFALLLVPGLMPATALAVEIAGVGRIQPAGGMINVSALTTDTITEIRVREGQEVKAGEVLAVLSSREERALLLDEAKLALEQAEHERASSLKIAQQKQADIRDGLAGAKARLASLYENKAESYVSPEYIADREGDIAEFEQQLQLSVLELEKLRRNMDLTVTRTQKQVASAEAALRNTSVIAPLNGRVFKVLGRPGEHVGPVLFMIGDTSAMYVLAEVYESDALRVRPGQKASIRSPAFPGLLTGTVESTGTMIYRSSLESLDAGVQAGSRVMEALIRLDPNEYAERLVNLQVDVRIRP